MNIEKGNFFTNEYAKAYSNCGILFIGYAEYDYIYEEFARVGYKNKVLQFQSIIKRSYIRKKNARKEF